MIRRTGYIAGAGGGLHGIHTDTDACWINKSKKDLETNNILKESGR